MPYLSQKILSELLYDVSIRKPYLRGSIVPTKRPTISYGRTRYTRFRGSRVGAKAGKEVATKAYVKKALQAEDVGTEVTAISTSYSCGSLIDYRIGKNIDKGNDSGDRKGMNIFIKTFRIFGSFKWDIASTGNPSGCHARILIVHDKTPLRAPGEAFFSTISDANAPVNFVNVPNAGATTEPINIVRPINTNRYTVLHERVYELGDKATNGYGVTPNLKLFDEKFKIDRKLTYTPEYNTAGTGITPCIRMFLFFIRDNGGEANGAIETNWQLEEHFSG